MDGNSLLTLPHMDPEVAQQLSEVGVQALPQLIHILRNNKDNKHTTTASSSSSSSSKKPPPGFSSSSGGGGRGNGSISSMAGVGGRGSGSVGGDGGENNSSSSSSRREGGGGGGGGDEPPLPDRGVVTGLLSRALGGAHGREVVVVCDRLPMCHVSWKRPRRVAQRLQQKQQQEEAVGGKGGGEDGKQHQQQQQGGKGAEEVKGMWGEEEIEEEAGAEGQKWMLEVEVVREGGRGPTAPRVVAPRFPKIKEEGWWLVLGDVGSETLLALRRVSFGGRTTARLTFSLGGVGQGGFGGLGGHGGQRPESLTLFLISDAYLGLDQQYEVRMRGEEGHQQQQQR